MTGIYAVESADFNDEISTVDQSSIVRRPISCTIYVGCRLTNLGIIMPNKPLEIGLCNKAHACCCVLKTPNKLLQISERIIKHKEEICKIEYGI